VLYVGLHILDSAQERVEELVLGGFCSLEDKVFCGLNSVEERVVLIARSGQDKDVLRWLQMGHGEDVECWRMEDTELYIYAGEEAGLEREGEEPLCLRAGGGVRRECEVLA